jgi:hypothetical protein
MRNDTWTARTPIGCGGATPFLSTAFPKRRTMEFLSERRHYRSHTAFRQLRAANRAALSEDTNYAAPLGAALAPTRPRGIRSTEKSAYLVATLTLPRRSALLSSQYCSNLAANSVTRPDESSFTF